MTEEEIATLVRTTLQEVLALEAPPPRSASLEQDLLADSLDLVESIETVEGRLASSGRVVRIPAERMREVVTVADAIELVVRAATPGGTGGGG